MLYYVFLPRYYKHTMVETLTMAVLGAPKVGKTAIIHQFLYHDFTEMYKPTECRDTYRPSVIFNGSMYDLKILDVPYLTAFPVNRSQVGTCLPCHTPPSMCRCAAICCGPLVPVAKRFSSVCLSTLLWGHCWLIGTMKKRSFGVRCYCRR